MFRQEGNQKRERKVFLKSRSKCVRQNNKLREEVGLLKEKLKWEKAKTDCVKQIYERLTNENSRKILMSQLVSSLPNQKQKETF